MVNVPVYGPTEGVPFPWFGIEFKEGENRKAFTAMVEDGAREIVGKITDKEFTMPQLNRVLEELGIHHEEHSIPPEVLATIEEKKKATAKNAKKQKTSAVAVASVVSKASSASGSVQVSANAEEFSAENTSGGPTKVVVEAEKVDAAQDIGGQRVEDMDRSKLSAANPMPGVLGGDSSSSKDAGVAGRRGALASDDAEARNRSHHCLTDTMVLEVSKDEAES
jgi:ribosomal protein L12E/L44/L45/RPP1/RPP2